MLLFNSLNILISIVIITSIVLRPYIVSQVRSSLISSLSLSFCLFRSFINHHLYFCHTFLCLISRHFSILHVHIPQSLSLFFLSTIRSLSLGKIIPILRYTLEKYAMPKIGWRPEGNHSVDITDNRCVYVCVSGVCMRAFFVFFYTQFWFFSLVSFLKIRQNQK